MIDPYGLRGDLGFDVAFLAASLANNQEDFLQRMSGDLRLPSAEDWFPSLVFYRLANSRKYKDVRAERALCRLAQRVL
jgi:hypothetical protein